MYDSINREMILQDKVPYSVYLLLIIPIAISAGIYLTDQNYLYHLISLSITFFIFPLPFREDNIYIDKIQKQIVSQGKTKRKTIESTLLFSEIDAFILSYDDSERDDNNDIILPFYLDILGKDMTAYHIKRAKSKYELENLLYPLAKKTGINIVDHCAKDDYQFYKERVIFFPPSSPQSCLKYLSN